VEREDCHQKDIHFHKFLRRREVLCVYVPREAGGQIKLAIPTKMSDILDADFLVVQGNDDTWSPTLVQTTPTNCPL